MKKNTASGKLRIIGGKWRSRILPVVDLPGLRPTTDRIRETVFNWLQADLGGALCLDCFAGSGALGFEAASRGAASVVMLELQAKAARQLNENIQTLKADNIQTIQQNCLSWLSAVMPGNVKQQQFDVVFLDPPFESELLFQACELLESHAWLSEQACIYIEMDSKQTLPTLPENWQETKHKKAGHVAYYLFRRTV